MKTKLNKELFKKDLPSLLRNFLIEKYDLIKNKDKPSKLEIKFLAYRALAYFQYLNTLYPSLAIQKFKDYVLSDGLPLFFIKSYFSIRKFLKRLGRSFSNNSFFNLVFIYILISFGI